MINDIPCNCYHPKADHKDLGDRFDEFTAWCKWSENGLCPCDYFTPLNNLEFLEYKYDRNKLDSKSCD